MDNKKVLVISHNAFSTTNNMGKTLNGLFKGIEKSNLAQLYFHEVDSDIDRCVTSFKITDKEVLKSLYTFKIPGKIVDNRNVNTNSKVKINKLAQNKTALKNLTRDIIWKLSKWKSKKLFKWIEEFKPDVVFFASGYAMFSYDIAIYISQKYNIPLVTYFCDDYYDYAYSSHKSLISNLRIKLFRIKMKDIVNKSSQLVFISESMMKKYEKLFNKKGVVIMTPYTVYEEEKKKTGEPLKLVYVGSVLSNRWKTLIKIGEALEQLNKDKQRMILEIYSQATDEEIISKLSIGESMLFKGLASAEQVKMIYKDADILLHIESFLEEDIIRVKHSISTKIADCLASNRAFLAVGPSDIASIQYLEQNNAAYVIKDQNEILKKLEEYFIRNNIKDEIINNAYKLAKKNHNPKTNIEKVKDIIDELN